jgi:hypothetical protein
MNRARPRPNPAPHSGPFKAEVLEVIDADRVLVRASSAPTTEIVRAELAVVGYAPAIGDRVLVEAVDDGYCVLGVLGEARRRRLEGDEFWIRGESGGGVELRLREGDLTLSAPGRIVLRAGEVETEAEVVRTSAREVCVEAGRMEVSATRIVERAEDTYRHVDGLAELQAGRARTLVDGAFQLAAKRTTVQSDEDTIIDGKRVLLG